MSRTDWAAALEQDLQAMADGLRASLRPWAAGTAVFTPEAQGYPGRGPATPFLQAAIDAARETCIRTVAAYAVIPNPHPEIMKQIEISKSKYHFNFEED